MKYYIRIKNKPLKEIEESCKPMYKMLKSDFGDLFEYDQDKIKEVTSLDENQVKIVMRKLTNVGAIELLNEESYLKHLASDLKRKSSKVDKTINSNQIVAKIRKYTANKELQETLEDFNEMRNRKKKPLTERAINLIFNKLDRTCISDRQKIEMVNRSIEHCWDTVYEEKANVHKQVDYDKMLLTLDLDYYKGLLVVEEDRKKGLKYAIDMAKEPSYETDLKYARALLESQY